jgi:hypothetical protein
LGTIHLSACSWRAAKPARLRPGNHRAMQLGAEKEHGRRTEPVAAVLGEHRRLFRSGAGTISTSLHSSDGHSATKWQRRLCSSNDGQKFAQVSVSEQVAAAAPAVPDRPTSRGGLALGLMRRCWQRPSALLRSFGSRANRRPVGASGSDHTANRYSDSRPDVSRTGAAHPNDGARSR